MDEDIQRMYCPRQEDPSLQSRCFVRQQKFKAFLRLKEQGND